MNRGWVRGIRLRGLVVPPKGLSRLNVVRVGLCDWERLLPGRFRRGRIGITLTFTGWVVCRLVDLCFFAGCVCGFAVCVFAATGGDVVFSGR